MVATCYKDGKKMVFQENICPVGWSDKEPEKVEEKPKRTTKKRVIKKDK
jgi:hypothetical protein